MASSKASEYLFLPDLAFEGDSPAVSEVPRSLAGRARVLHELLTGLNPFKSEPPASMRNPDGRIGHNHRGPPWGTAFKHPIAWCSGRQATSDIQGERTAVRDAIPAAVDAENPGSQHIRNWVVWIPPYWTPAGTTPPYRKLFFRFLGFTTSATNTDITVTARRASQYAQDTGSVSTATLRFSTTTDAAGVFTGDELFVLTEPGAYNVIGLDFVNETARDVTISSIALCQVVKRGH